MRYAIGIFVICPVFFICSGFYCTSTTNAIFVKVGSLASEEVMYFS